MRHRWLAIPVVALLVLAGCGDDDDDDGGDAQGGGGGNTGTVTVLNAMEQTEVDALNEAIGEFLTDADYEVEIEASDEFEEQAQIRVEGGNPSDIHMYPQPGTVQELAASGDAIALEDLGLDVAALTETFGEYLMSLGEFEGKHYGLPTNVNLKSMVWYPKDDFDAAGYEIPETFDELVALSEQIVGEGKTPWCMGFESGAATGWPATDWMEDIMLRTAGPDVYDQWVAHEIPFNDPSVQTAGERFGEVLFADGFVLGGIENTPSINFGDSVAPMFDDPPGCFLHRQASFINSFFPEDSEAGVDYDWFPFPPIDQEGTLFAGELSVVFRDAPEVRDFLEAFAGEEMQCAQGGAQGTSRISPNVEVGGDCYANEQLARAAEVLTGAIEAGNGRFDASDLMPSAVGAGSFWTGMVRYIQSGPDSLPGVLEEIENSYPE